MPIDDVRHAGRCLDIAYAHLHPLECPQAVESLPFVTAAYAMQYIMLQCVDCVMSCHLLTLAFVLSQKLFMRHTCHTAVSTCILLNSTLCLVSKSCLYKPARQSLAHSVHFVRPCSCVLCCLQLSTYVSFWTADKFGRRALFLQAGVQMAMALLAIAVSLKTLGSEQPREGVWLAWYVLGLTCVYDM